MCYSVYIGTTEEQEVGKFVPNKTDIYFEKLNDEEEIGLWAPFALRKRPRFGPL
jgi:hypothetical protein